MAYIEDAGPAFVLDIFLEDDPRAARKDGEVASERGFVAHDLYACAVLADVGLGDDGQARAAASKAERARCMFPLALPVSLVAKAE